MQKLLQNFVGEVRSDWRILMAGSGWQRALGLTGFIIFWFPGGLLVITPVYLSYKYISKRR